jgi:hypothetical protein
LRDTVRKEMPAKARSKPSRVYCDGGSVEPPVYLLRIAPEVYREEQERVAHRFEEAPSP